MSDSRSTDAEHRLQHRFSKFAPLAVLLVPLAVLLFAWILEETPNREVTVRRAIEVAFDPVDLDEVPQTSLRLAGAWALSSPDPDFGGISALAIEPGGLLALSDLGRLIHLPRPSARAAHAIIEDLPDGPGNPRFKQNRDSEALFGDSDGQGWWVAFESRHELWLYNSTLQHALKRIGLPAGDWLPNAGVEAMSADGTDLLLFPENAGAVIRFAGSQAVEAPVRGLDARISDAAMLPDGRLLVIERGMGWLGFVNSLVLLERDGRGYRAAARMRLPLGPLDNAEALAVETLGGGAVRLWLMTDDNFQKPPRTLLLALDLPPRRGRAE